MVQTLDPRRILRGYDGRLFHDGDFLATVNRWNGQVNITNEDEQPAGSRLIFGLDTGYSVSLTFTETVVEDLTLLKKLLDRIKGDDIDFDFVSRLRGHNGDNQSLPFRSCVPDGQIDLVNVEPGTIIRRAWSWRVNEPPELQDLLGQ